MNQQETDLPRPVRILKRFKTLIGFTALAGLIAGGVLAAIIPSSASDSASVVFTAPSCPQGAICGGAFFSPGYVVTQLQKTVPAGIQIKAVTGNVVSVVATARTPAGARTAANAAIAAYIADVGSLSYMGESPSAALSGPAQTATAPLSPKRLLDWALLGALAGLLVGAIAALIGGQTIIDPVSLPRGLGTGGTGDAWGTWGAGAGGAGAGGAGVTGFSLRQIALDQPKRDDDRDMLERFGPS